MRTTRQTRVVRVILTAVLAAASGFGQENYGAIAGTVLDPTGASIPGVRLSASTPSLPRPIEVETDSAGRYAMQRLPVGIYAITVSKSGFSTVRQMNVDVRLGSQITLNPSLTVSAVSD